MTKVRSAGFQKPRVGKPDNPVTMATITFDGRLISCSCGGWSTAHPRKKVREDRAEKHVKAKHHGMAMWL